MGYEQGQSEGYEIGYQDCKDKYKNPQEDWKELERSLRVNLEPENKPKPTTADAASQTGPQFGHSKDVNTLAYGPLPPVQPSPVIVDTSPSLLPTKNAPRGQNVCHHVLIIVVCRPPGRLSTDNAYH